MAKCIESFRGVFSAAKQLFLLVKVCFYQKKIHVATNIVAYINLERMHLQI